jgi:hypothetical protein
MLSPNFFFLEPQFVVFWHIQQFLLYFTRIHYCVTGSDCLKITFSCRNEHKESKNSDKNAV